MDKELQRRYVPRATRKPELQQRADGALPLIVGYASVFYREGDAGTEYEIWGAEYGLPRVVERMMPTAFNRAIAEDDVRGLFNHDSAIVLGRSGAGTLRLSVDAIGLRYEIDPPDTQAARDLIQSLKRGDITGSSFAFIPRDTATREVKGDKFTTIYLERNDVQLFDVGPVTYPAYAAATSAARSAGGADAVRAEVQRWRDAHSGDALAVMLAALACDEES